MGDDIGVFVFFGVEDKADCYAAGIGVRVEIGDAGDSCGVGEADPDGGGGVVEVEGCGERAGFREGDEGSR